MFTPWKKSYDQPRQLIKKQRYSFVNKGLSSKAMVYLVVMDGCDSWTIKKATHQRIDAFELWCWRRFLRAPWNARRSNQSLLKEISPGCSLDWKRVFAMISAFSQQNYQHLPFILYAKAKFACYSRYFLTSYFCIPVPYDEKDIFFRCQFQKVFVQNKTNNLKNKVKSIIL